jgi:GNAT superfamily N-acetyltransferase
MVVFFYDDSYLEQLVKFINKVWEKDMTPDLYLERRERDLLENPYAKEGGFPIAIATDDNKILGHHAGTPFKLWVEGKEFLSYWLAGLHVLPEGRRKGLAKALQQTTNNLRIATSFWVIKATLKVKQRFGWTVVGKIPEYIKILDSKKFITAIDFKRLNQLPDLLKTVCELLFSTTLSPGRIVFTFVTIFHKRAFSLLFPKKKSDIIIQEVKKFDKRIDDLWNRNKVQIKFAQIRNSDYLNWQFKSDLGWVKIIANNNSIISGYAIVSLKNMDKTKDTTEVTALCIIDIFWDFNKPEILDKLINYIEEMSRKLGAKILICSINDKTAKRVLFKNSFIRIPGTVYFGFHCSDDSLKLSPKLNDWFITRGDADAAGSLSPNG